MRAHTLYTYIVALPPTLPTSFVPRQPMSQQLRRSRPAQGVFYYVALFIMGVAVVGAAGTFGYEKYLVTVRTAKDLTLKESEKNVDKEAVADFIRLRNRMQVGNNVLDRHVMTSQFFDVLEGLTLQNVRFQSIQLTVADDRTAKIEMHGMARSFNALASQSAGFANETSIKRAIFSGITADKNGIVKFSLQADLTPSLVIVSKDGKSQTVETPPNIATTTPFETAPPVTASTTKAAATTTP